jgi:FkbM family methyltransferase
VKVLWHSVAPWVGSGYGQQTAINVPRIQALGHDVAISAYYGLQGSKLRWNGVDVYPAYEPATYGADIVVSHAIDWFGANDRPFEEAAAAGIILTLTDVWAIQCPMLVHMAVCSWVPIDHIGLPGIVDDWFRQTGAQPIAMSRFGERELAKAGHEPLYVPHGIDTRMFAPGDRSEARVRQGLPDDAFVVALMAANIGKDGSRKAFKEQIAAFAELRRRHSDAMLVLHTDVANSAGVDIMRMLSDLPEGSYRYTDQYAYRKGLPVEAVADLYRAANVYTNASWGEGFGIGIIEAQACGTPVIVTDATAMPELCGAGWRVGFEPIWHESQGAWAAIPRVSEIAAAYLEAYDQADSLRDDARAFAEQYDADLVAEMYWEPALKQISEALDQRLEDARTPTPPSPSAHVGEASGLLWLDRGPGYGDHLGPSSHESELAPILDSLLPEGGVMLEVGAHVGHWTLRLAAKAGHIIAVEANPDTASMLRRNLGLNDIDNVVVLEQAAWDSETTLRLDDPIGQTAGGSTRTLPTDGDGVPASRLDALDIGRLDLVKLDVEGADLHALRGMTGLLDQHHPTLFIECHDCYGYYTRAELEDTLTGLGYDWQIAHTYQTTWHPDGTQAPVDADYLVCTPTGEPR